MSERRVGEPTQDEQAIPTPWSFWVLVGAAAFYVGVRIVQMISWLFD